MSESWAVNHFPGVSTIGRILSGPNSFQDRGTLGGGGDIVSCGDRLSEPSLSCQHCLYE